MNISIHTKSKSKKTDIIREWKKKKKRNKQKKITVCETVKINKHTGTQTQNNRNESKIENWFVRWKLSTDLLWEEIDSNSARDCRLQSIETPKQITYDWNIVNVLFGNGIGGFDFDKKCQTLNDITVLNVNKKKIKSNM